MVAAARAEVAVIHRPVFVRDAACDDDAVLDMRMDQPRKGKSAEVIDPELQLEALFRQRFGRDHHPGVVDEDVDPRPCKHRLRRIAHLVEIRKIEWLE